MGNPTEGMDANEASKSFSVESGAEMTQPNVESTSMQPVTHQAEESEESDADDIPPPTLSTYTPFSALPPPRSLSSPAVYGPDFSPTNPNYTPTSIPGLATLSPGWDPSRSLTNPHFSGTFSFEANPR